MKRNIMTVLVAIGVIVSVYMLIFDNGTSSPSTSNTPSVSTSNVSSVAETESEYGLSLAECLQKADEWFVDSKQTTLDVIADEEKRGLYTNYDKQKELNYLMSSLYEELSDYKKECETKFK